MEWNSLVPELTVSNFDNSLYFYVHILGFEIKYQRKNPRFAYLEFESSQIMKGYERRWKMRIMKFTDKCRIRGMIRKPDRSAPKNCLFGIPTAIYCGSRKI